MTKPTLPQRGTSTADVLKRLQAHRGQDVDWKSGRTFSLVYYAGEQVMQLLHDAYSMFMAENGLSPMAFPSLRDMENEVVAPVTAHPAFIKSAHYLDMGIEFTPLQDDWRADSESMKAAVDDDTVIHVVLCRLSGVDQSASMMAFNVALGRIALEASSSLGR